MNTHQLSIKNVLLVVSALIGQLALVGCGQEYNIKLSEKAQLSGSNSIAAPGGTQSAKESFNVVTSSVKKIDFLFVIDNSGSMADNQSKLAAGFEKFADTFYRRTDLDICTFIITSDRYLGKTGSNNYQRERNVGCTKPAGSENWTQSQMDAHIDSLISDFKTKANVGTNGSGTELLGKSLVSYLYKLNQWGNTINTSVTTDFFRSDAIANISFVTDENNWYYNGNQNEPSNDLPGVKNAIYSGNSTDGRTGIKDHLNSFFGNLNPNKALTYSTTTLSDINSSSDNALNLSSLKGIIGRESDNGDINGSATAYADIYDLVSENLANRAYAFNVIHDIYSPSSDSVKVTLVSGSNRNLLVYGVDYTILVPNGVSLLKSIVDNASSGDKLEVEYTY